MEGPLAGIRVVEFEGIGPAPYAGMLLADLGAEVLRIARDGARRGPLIADTGGAVLHRGRPSMSLDLKSAAGREAALAEVAGADALIEGLRPGAMERLGLGPAETQEANPALVYLRLTGWGQTGPLAQTAGHDINYIALAGVLGTLGPADRPPPPPLNLVGDFGGGGLWGAFGLLAGVIEARRTGRGRVIDAAMLDGAASQMAMILAWSAAGLWSAARGANLLDGGAPFYRCYRCACGGHVAVGAIEPAFFALLMQGLCIASEGWDQTDRDRWPEMADRIAGILAAHPRAHWEAVFAGTDACVTPVLGLDEAARHPHNRARATFTGDPPHPAAGPRFGRAFGASAPADAAGPAVDGTGPDGRANGLDRSVRPGPD